jgi:Carboxylesterase family
MVCSVITGLYHQAIAESGTEFNVWSINTPVQEPEKYVYQVAEKVNCDQTSDSAMVACLRSRSATALRLAQDIECTVLAACPMW